MSRISLRAPRRHNRGMGSLRPVDAPLVGRRGKYLVLLTWLVLLAVAWPLAGKLTGAEKNDSTAWLPGAAESTRVLSAESAIQSPNTSFAVVVFQRDPALTQADRAEIAADARAFAGVAASAAPLAGRSGPRRPGAQVVVPMDLGHGWKAAAGAMGR